MVDGQVGKLGQGIAKLPDLSTLDDDQGQGQGQGVTFTGGLGVDPRGAPQRGSVPGQSETWMIGGITHLVWVVDGFNPPLYMAWAVTDEQFPAIFGKGGPDHYNEQISWDQANSLGLITHGNVSNINNDDRHPLDTFLRDFDREAQIRPWLREPEMLALHVAAVLEGRPVTDAELQTTNWWRTRNEAERAWLTLNFGDPSEAVRRIDDYRRTTRELMIQLGIDNPDSSLITAVADRVVTGQWSETYASDQVRKLSDPYAPGILDPALEEIANQTGIDISRAEEGTVQDALTMWLGPKFGEQTDAWIQQWAGELRNDPDAELELTELLQGQRMALFPEYTNPNVTYQDIAGAVRGQYQQIWGQEPDELDPLFFDIAQSADINARAGRLRQEGLQRGVKKVNDAFQTDIMRSFGGQIRRAI